MSKEKIELKGYEQMSNYEIFARNYLAQCGEELIVKDNSDQLEFREDNFRESKDFYNKCKYIVNIEDFLGYDEESSIYKMNWSAIIVYYKDGNIELWDRP
jgi:hypothetical protein